MERARAAALSSRGRPAPDDPPDASPATSASEEAAATRDTPRTAPAAAGVDSQARLKAIIYSEFDNTLGPTMRCQAPEGFLSQELFESISDYLITGRQLYGRTIAVATAGEDYQVVGFPLCIENEKYARNTFLFNVSFVLRRNEDTMPYEPILRKLALTLHAMEVESEFLFRPEKKAHLGVILEKVLQDLNAHGECLLTLDEANLLSLKLTTVVQEPPAVGDHEVPVFLRDPEILKALDWDLALRQVIPHIDGVKYAKRLAMDAEMDVDCAKAALRTLVYFDFVALLDIFQFSNVYVTTEAFPEFCRNPALQQECQRFVATSLSPPPPPPPAAGGATINGSPTTATTLGGPQGLPTVQDLLALYSACRPDATLVDVFLARRDKMESIDPRRFVTFGLVYGFLRRVHRYPVFIKGPGPPSSLATVTAALTAAGIPLAPAPVAAAAAGAAMTTVTGANPSGGAEGGIVFPPSRNSSQWRAGVAAAAAGAGPASQQQQQHQHLQQAQLQQQLQQALAPTAASSSSVTAELVLEAQEMMDGTRTADELCVALMRPYQELADLALAGGGDGAEILILYK